MMDENRDMWTEERGKDVWMGGDGRDGSWIDTN